MKGNKHDRAGCACDIWRVQVRQRCSEGAWWRESGMFARVNVGKAILAPAAAGRVIECNSWHQHDFLRQLSKRHFLPTPPIYTRTHSVQDT
jgi:hypothetical protein